MRLAIFACILATPLAAQEGGVRLPVFTPDANLPTVREREQPTIRQTARPGINVVPRAVWGTRPRPRPVQRSPLVEAPAQPAPESQVARDDAAVPSLAQRVAVGGQALSLPAVPPASDLTPVVTPSPVLPQQSGRRVIQVQEIALPRTRPIPRGSSVEADEAPEVIAQAETPETDQLAPVIEDVLNTLREEVAEPAPDSVLPELQAAEEIISGSIVVESLSGSSTSETIGLRPRAAPAEAVDQAPAAVLRGLDKVSGVVRDIEIAVGETAQLGRLSVSLSECRYPVANPSGNAYAWLDITVEGLSDPAFQGWMMAASPALNALDHPRYDVWVIRCSNS
ncbi:MAG: DUF2155 domain-containing protein [Pseudomonadota bacterium]